ncbi:unnamed protein product [Adineta ricciae]|uniref:G-protein coupled receptors family 1 profile domain-containing protein n=1 Tax=Adineta ricciae TaxID=249248 RepID=A0A814V6A9_ADIRI|nr:unnamed protein product [Adineta ricciae]CAF1185965.1 unnamed protein product [Adineta ricciae]
MFQVPRLLRFSCFLVFNITSLTSTLFILAFLLLDRTSRQALYNHIIIVLLILGFIYELTNILFHLYNDYNGVPLSTSPAFYIFWVFLDYSLYSLQIALFAWASIERHILIFHDQWLSTAKKRLFIHYLPPTIIIVYYLIYYCMVYFATPCDYSFDGFLHGGIYIPCPFDRTFLASWDLLVHQVFPTLVIVVFCVALLVRVIRQKARMHRANRWRESRRMTVQLLSISLIYVLFNLPWVTVIFAYQCGWPASLAIDAILFSKFLCYNVIFCFPYVTCLAMKQFRVKVMELTCYRGRGRQVVPNSTIGNAVHGRTLLENKELSHAQ